MEQHELRYQTLYSANLESMTATLLGRTDRLVSFFTLLFSAAVFSSLPQGLVGTILAALSAYAFSYQPGQKATLARAQADNYLNLHYHIRSLTFDAKPEEIASLEKEFCALREKDSTVIGSLWKAADIRTRVLLEQPVDKSLNRLEVLVSWCAGDLPSERLPRPKKPDAA